MNDQDKTNDELIKQLQELQQENNLLKASFQDRITGSKATEIGLTKNHTKHAGIIKAGEDADEFAENIINTLREPLLVLDQDLRVVKASRSFYNLFKVTAGETVGKLIYDLGNNQWDIPKLRELLETILPEKTTFDDYEVEHDFSAIGKRVMLLNARQIKRAFGKEKIILLAIEDITERKSTEELITEKSRITTEYLDILLNHSHAPIIIWDSSLVIKQFNHEFEKLSGYKSSEVIDKKIDILFPEGKIDSTLELLTNHLSNENPQVTEIDILTKDKNIKTVLWNSANVFDKEGTSVVATITQDISSRKQTEVALRNSETRLRTLVHTIPDLIWLKDTEGVYLSCNPMFERFFGAKEADIIGKTDYDFVDQELAGFFRENDRKAMEAGTPTSNEEWITFADDGHQAYVETIKTPMHDSNGILLGVLGIGRDITDRKHAEESLKKQKNEFETIFNLVPAQIWYKDTHNNVIRVNRQACIDLGMTNDKIEGHSAEELFPSFAQKYFKDDLEVFNTQKSKLGIIEQINTSKGEIRWLNSDKIPVFGDDGEINGLIAVIQDITERKQADEKLRVSESRFKQVSENAQELIWEVDQIGLYTYVSPVIKDLLGYEPEEIVGKKHFYDLFDQQNRVEVKQDALEVFAQKTSFKDFVNTKQHKDGRKVILSTSAIPMFDSKGNLIGYRGVDTDITERIYAEKKLLESEEKFRAFFENSMDAILLTSVDRSIFSANPAACSMFGYSEDELIKVGRSGVVDTTDPRLSVLLAERKLNGNAQGEITCIRKNGTHFPGEISSSIFKNPEGSERTSMIIRDITGRKRAEDEITMLSHSLKSVNECVSITDLDNKILFVNESFLKTYGYNINELIGKHISLVSSKYNSQDHVKEISLATIQGEWQGELLNRRKDGSEFPVYLSTSVIKDKASKVIGMIGVATDITERKQAENALRESESRFKAIFNKSPIAIALLDTKGHIIISNLPLSDMVGYSNDELSKMKFIDFTYHEDADKDMNQFIELIGGRISNYSMEKRFVHKNGNLVWGNLYVTIIHDENGISKEVIGMVVDITGRKQTEEQLRESEERFRKLYENAKIGFYRTTPDGTILMANKALVSMLGFPSFEMLAARNLDYEGFGPTYQRKEFLEKIEKDGEVNNFESEWIRRDGSKIFVQESAQVIRDSHDSILYFDGVIEDITERRRAEETLLKLSSAVEQTVDSIIITDRDGTIEYVNRAFELLTGYPSEEALGKTPRILKSGIQDQKLYEDLWTTILSGKVFKAEFINKKKNGDLYDEEKTIAPIFDKNKNITHFVGTGVDITKRKLARIELIEAKNKAEESDRLKSAFLTNMSHEIRTPLNGILGFTGLLKTPELSGKNQQEYIKIIEKSGERMLNIISDIISISIVESGNLKISIAATDMNKQIEFLYTFFRPEAMQKGLELYYTKSLPVGESVVLTDKEKVNTILSNLIKNAIKFTHTGSIEFGYGKKGQFLEYFVKDTGIGIVQEKMEIIFDRFRQGSESKTRNYEGAGLGLSISKAYAEALGGKIRVESIEGKGSTFYFTIPYQAAPEEKIVKKNAVSANEAVNQPRKLKILIAEDDETSEMLIRIVVRIFSDDILEATTGIEAIEVCRNNPDIDLVLMDIKMPVMDGLEATRQIRQFNKEVIIIAQTAYGLSGDKKTALEAGCNEYISKPIDLDVIRLLIQKHFYQKKGD